MTRQLDLASEVKASNRALLLEKNLDYGLPGAIEANGLTFLGFAAYYELEDCMIVLKATTGRKKQVAFVFGDSLGGCINKAVRKAQRDALKWREDKHPGK